jgi:hypothetical protein
MLHTRMACSVFRGSYWELPLSPGSIIFLTDDWSNSYIEENNGLITILYESVLFYSSCNSKCMLRKASAILLLCPEFRGTITYDSPFLCRKQTTEFIGGTDSRNKHFGFPVIQKTRTITQYMNVFTSYADLPVCLRIPYYIPNQCCYSHCSHVEARHFVTILARSLVTLLHIAFTYEHYAEQGVRTSRQRVVLRLVRCKGSSVLWNVTKGTELGQILEETAQ